MKCINLIILTVVAFVWFLNGYAQQGSQTQRDIWLINIPTPYTLGKGGIELDFIGRYINYNNPDPRTDVVDFIFMGNYGLTARLSLSFITPFSWISGPPKFGIKDVSLSLKYKVWDARRFKIALSPKFLLPTGSKDDLLGSGKINFQLDVHLGFEQDRFRIFTNLGYGETGYIEPHLIINPSGSIGGYEGTVRNEQIYKFSGGLAFDIIPSITFLLEGIGQVIPEFSDEDLFFQIGGILRITNLLLLKGSGGIGLPRDERTITDSQATIGLSYLIR